MALLPMPASQANTVNNDIFKNYDATIVNFWTNGCGSCIAEMPELEEYYQQFKDKNINLIAVAASAGDSDEMRAGAEKILKEKGVTYTNIIPDIESSFYKDFICEITGFPITYIVDSDGYMVGAPLIGVVKKQEDNLMKRLNEVTK
ncbi:TlpA disulfide reductase family protein [Hydrogenoanaerobacterium sp.]|uniref:TlpA disulfide reductase family protein n=1 Tax=Hydrogenoanaerobacterium sp. TaxID=2953763 RepID=UPI00289692F1|nr:TlpA disulfide reductase family protein [Hydrogenoanaerobacterium sp.]